MTLARLWPASGAASYDSVAAALRRNSDGGLRHGRPAGRRARHRSGCRPRSRRSIARTARERPTCSSRSAIPTSSAGCPRSARISSAGAPISLTERAVARALAGVAPITGRLPIALPPSYRARLGRCSGGCRSPYPVVHAPPDPGRAMHLVLLRLADHRCSTSSSRPPSDWPTRGRRASRSPTTSSPGRSLPWWLAGTSMVATTFAADTPLAVAGWSPSTAWPATGSGGTAPSRASSPSSSSRGCGAGPACSPTWSSPSCATAAARRRSLRGFRAVYLAIPINLIIMGWVTRAMVTILQISLNIDPVEGGHPPVRRDRAVQRLRRPVGRHRHRPVPVRVRHGRLHPARGARGAVGRRPRGPDREGQPRISARPRRPSA